MKKEYFNSNITCRVPLILALLFLLQSCVDPIEPEFDYVDGLLFVDAYALTKENLSSVSLKRSYVNNQGYSVLDEENATVNFVNVSTGESVSCAEGFDGNYFPPEDFAVKPGEEWKLEIQLSNGQRYESKAERIRDAIPINEIKAYFSNELYFDDGFDKFIPGHMITMDWNDPAGEKNYYLWRYRSFEPLNVCKTCEQGRLRNGICTNEGGWGSRYFNYLCKPDCWQIRYSERFQLFDDRLVDGRLVTDQKVADIPYYRKEDILVEIQQLTLTESGYEYFQIVDDIGNESGGLNAPPPAALIGNLYSLDDPDEIVLGQFVASGVSTKNIFIYRDQLLASPVTPDDPIRLEECGTPCPDSLVYFPCIEGDYRTSRKPDDWPG